MRRLTQRECTRILTTRFRDLEHRRLTDIKTSELAAVLDMIEKPAERRNGFVWLRAFLTWCYQRGYLDINPISRLRPPASSRPRERVLSDPELICVWNASQSTSCAAYGALVRLCLLSGQRRGQWQQLQPEFILGDTITWPSGVMKANRPHTIPLNDAIRREIGDHTFRGWKEDYQKRTLDKRAGIPHFTMHDLRRTAATRMADLGVAPHVVERLLAHAQPTMQGIYNRASYIVEMRDALNRWHHHLQTLMGQNVASRQHAATCGSM